MTLHLVGGFLGSGKTTGISVALQLLAKQGTASAVITNDQGKYLVDSEYFRSSGIPAGEVTGGCFCCNYHDLVSEIGRLEKKHGATIVFAESVGSCTDLIATVAKPLLQYKAQSIELLTFSTFVDARLLHRYLNHESLPFKVETNYIWEKQVEESEILVVNKVDLLKLDEFNFLKAALKRWAREKTVLFQNSHDAGTVKEWVDVLLQERNDRPHKAIEVDYEKYAVGEAHLAWLDESIEINSVNNSAMEVAQKFMAGFIESLSSRQIPVGHLKFILQSDDRIIKFSYTSLLDKEDPPVYSPEPANRAVLMVNARVQTSPDMLRRTVSQLLHQLRVFHDVNISESKVSFFSPGFPKPSFRLT